MRNSVFLPDYYFNNKIYNIYNSITTDKTIEHRLFYFDLKV